MNIDHITFYGGSKREARKFYGNILKFKTKEVDGKIWIKIGEEFIIHLSSDKKSVTKGKFHFGIGTSNPSVFARSIIEKNVQIFDIVEGKEIHILEVLDDLRQFFVRDPAGNILEFLKV